MDEVIHAEINELQNKNAQGEGAIAHHKDKVKALNQDMASNVERLELERSDFISEISKLKRKIKKQENEEKKLNTLVSKFMEKQKCTNETV
jgi:chromosome segregation ATPase